MKCAQCDAFESTFKAAGIRYAAAAYNLEEKISASISRDDAFLKLEREAMSARLDYKMAREALGPTLSNEIQNLDAHVEFTFGRDTVPHLAEYNRLRNNHLNHSPAGDKLRRAQF